jgi:putative ABC transport system permease protein
MITSFFTVALRNFLKRPALSLLNVLGLAIGLACSIYVFLFVFDELTYDTQHPDSQNTYRMITKMKRAEGSEQTLTWAIIGWAHYMKENLKGVKSYSTIKAKGWSHSFYYKPENGEQRVTLSEDVIYVDKNYTDFFFLDLLEGDKNTVFDEPTNVAISESEARKLFGNESALNKQLEFSHPLYIGNAKTSLIVKGVFRDLPYNVQFGRTTRYILNSHLAKPELERRYGNARYEDMLTAMWWPAVNGYIYIKTEPHADLQYLKERAEMEINKALSVKLESPPHIEINFLKITDIHFSDIPYLIFPDVKGNRQYIYIFLTIGVFILLISCMNYTNLATARCMTRAREAGMRKAMGSYKHQIVFQFLQEAFLMTGLAVVLSLLLAIAFLPLFSDFSKKDFIVPDIFSIECLSFVILLWVVVSVCSGFYPAVHIASFNTIKMLRGSVSSGKSANLVRGGLTVFQFTVCLILVVFSLVVINQMNGMINTDLNKAGDQIMTIRYGNVAPYNKLQVFQNELSKYADFSISSFGNHLPRGIGHAPMDHEVTMPGLNTEKYKWDMMCVGANYDKVFDLELIAGSFFDSSRPMDSTEILVNEGVTRLLQMDANALLGHEVVAIDGVFNKEYHFKIRGVFKDFKYQSIHNEIAPLMLSLQKERHNGIAYFVKLPVEGIQKNVAAVEKIWKEVMPPDVGFKYRFLSDEFEQLYFEENALHDLSRAFTALGILTMCIGLFGTSVFLAEQKSKEMAIRKVVGAGNLQVLIRMVSPFIRFLSISILLGLPVAYYCSNRWLDTFVYKVQLGWGVTLFSVFVVLLVTLLTVSFQSIRIANANPVNSLKHE